MGGQYHQAVDAFQGGRGGRPSQGHPQWRPFLSWQLGCTDQVGKAEGERECLLGSVSPGGRGCRERPGGDHRTPPAAGCLLSPPSLFKGKFEYSHTSKPRIDWIADFPLDDTPLPSSARLPPPPLIVVMTETALFRSSPLPSSTVRVEQESRAHLLVRGSLPLEESVSTLELVSS